MLDRAFSFSGRLAGGDEAAVAGGLDERLVAEAGRRRPLEHLGGAVAAAFGPVHQHHRIRGDRQRPGLLGVQVGVVDDEQPARRQRREAGARIASTAGRSQSCRTFEIRWTSCPVGSGSRSMSPALRRRRGRRSRGRAWRAAPRRPRAAARTRSPTGAGAARRRRRRRCPEPPAMSSRARRPARSTPRPRPGRDRARGVHRRGEPVGERRIEHRVSQSVALVLAQPAGLPVLRTSTRSRHTGRALEGRVVRRSE